MRSALIGVCLQDPPPGRSLLEPLFDTVGYLSTTSSLSIHSHCGGWFIVRVFRSGWCTTLVFCADCKGIVMSAKLDSLPVAFLPLNWYSYPCHLHRGSHLAHLFAP